MLTAVCVVGIIASVAVMAIVYRPGDPLRAYYGTDARAHTILMGALLAIVLVVWTPGAAAKRRLRTASVIAFVVMIYAWHVATGTSARYYHGGSIAYAALACVVIAGALQPGVLQAMLAIRPLAWIGRISYGLYLFHWPLIVLLVPSRLHGLHGLPLNLLRLTVTFAAATLSFYLVELPIRERRRPTLPWHPAPRADRRALGPGGAMSRGGSRFPRSAPRSQSCSHPQPARRRRPAISPGARRPRASRCPRARGWPHRAARTLRPPPRRRAVHRPRRSRPRPSTSRRPTPTFRGPTAIRSSAAHRVRTRPTRPSTRRTSSDRPRCSQRAAGLRVLIVGDSTACSLYPGLKAVGDEVGADVYQAAVFGCGVASGQITTTRDEQVTPHSERCPFMVDEAVTPAIFELRPQIVVWMSIWEKSDLIVGNQTLVSGTPAGEAAMLARMDAELARLTVYGAKVVVLTEAAAAPNDAQGVDNTSNAVDNASYARLGTILHDFADRNRGSVDLVDLAKQVCPNGPPCPEDVDGLRLRPDGRHFTPGGRVDRGTVAHAEARRRRNEPLISTSVTAASTRIAGSAAIRKRCWP